jgi:MFS family permease
MRSTESSAYLRQVRRFGRNARLFLLSQLLAGIASGVYSLLFNLYLIRLGYNEEFIGQVNGLSVLATGLVAFPAGLLADRIGRRRTMIVGAFIPALAYLGQSSLADAQAILLFGIAAGAGIALVTTCFSPFMAENSGSEERPYLFSVNFALATLAAMSGSLLGGNLPRIFADLFAWPVDSSAPYRLALQLAAVMFGLAAVPFILTSESPHGFMQAELERPDISMARADIRGRMLSFAVVNVLVGIAGGLILPFFNVYFVETFTLPAQSVGMIFAVSQALMALGVLVAPALARRTGKVNAIVAGHFATGPFLFILAAAGNPWVAATAYWGRNLAMNIISPIQGTFAMEMVPARLRGTLSGINSMAWNTTWAISSVVGGVLILALGYPRIFLISAACYAITGSVYFLAFRRYRNL